jgi:hypothetical protein
VPSTSDGAGGKDFHVYAESFNGGALQCFVGENSVQSLGGGGVLTYPGKTQLPAANCVPTLGPNGNITIYVPVSSVNEADPVDTRLHEVTASTMTLLEPANTQQPDPVFGFGGSYFNLIDVAQGYVFDPILVGAVSRKVHGIAGTFDIDLLPPAAGIECRSGGTSNDYQVVVTFASPVTVTDATVAPGANGTAAVVGSPITAGAQVTVNLTNVSNAQALTLTLIGPSIGSLSVPMAVLVGDVTANRVVSNTDVSSVKGQVAAPVTSSNFRNDVTANGIISNTDVSTTKTQVGTVLP